MKKLSVIIPTYNRAAILEFTLNSLVLQSIGNDSFEVIVVDDGSNDNTEEIVTKFRNKLELKYIFQEDKGFRVSKARNEGIRVASAPICVFIDSGLVLSKKALEYHLKAHNNKEGFLAVIGYVYGFDDLNKHESNLLSMVDYGEPDISIKVLQSQNIWDSREPLYQKHGDCLASWPAPWIIFWCGNVSVHKHVLEHAGLFDESFTSWGCEDIDLGLSLTNIGSKFVLERNAAAIDYPHKKDNMWTKDENQALIDFRNKQKYMYEKHKNDQIVVWMQNYYTEVNDVLLKN